MAKTPVKSYAADGDVSADADDFTTEEVEAAVAALDEFISEATRREMELGAAVVAKRKAELEKAASSDE